MGVTRAFKYSSKDFREEMNRILKVLTLMNSLEISAWNVTITVMHHKNVELASNLYLLAYADHQVAVLWTQKNKEVIQCDKNLVKVIESLQSFRVRQQYCINGCVMQLGDFVFRVGIGSISNESRCLVCEVEFLGTRFISEATPSINELMRLIDPNVMLTPIEIRYDSFFTLNSEEASLKTTAIDLLFCLNCINL